MLDFLACQSPEKLVIDAEAIGAVMRLVDGIKVHTETLALEMFTGFSFKGDFLRQRLTRELFQIEQYLPSDVIDRGSIRIWEQNGRLDAFARARTRVDDILAAYTPPKYPEDIVTELRDLVHHLAGQAGMDELPPLGID